jgi:hypothetical protein
MEEVKPVGGCGATNVIELVSSEPTFYKSDKADEETPIDIVVNSTIPATKPALTQTEKEELFLQIHVFVDWWRLPLPRWFHDQVLNNPISVSFFHRDAEEYGMLVNGLLEDWTEEQKEELKKRYQGKHKRYRENRLNDIAFQHREDEEFEIPVKKEIKEEIKTITHTPEGKE